jgi:hypothetical protein
MFTSLDKALVALIMAVLYIVNNVFGLHVGIDPAMLSGIIVALTPILVYIFPNKPKIA